MTLSTKIVLAAINYKKLDEESLDKLESASLKRTEDYLRLFKENLGVKVDSIAVIEKCNSVMVFISFREEFSMKHIKSRLLSTWDLISYKGISSFIKDVIFYEDLDALKFLGECSIGAHSVTIGDSQVLSQILEGLHTGQCSSGEILRIISEWTKNIVYECKLKTKIFSGNTSIERIASELIISSVNKNKKILVVGYGKSGKLISKILSEEANYDINVINRSVVDKDEFWPKACQNSFFNFDDNIDLKNIGGVVVALNNNKETIDKVRMIIKKLGNNDIFYLDLSTPSIINDMVGTFVGISSLSEIANKNLNNRFAEVNKAKAIILNNLKNLVDSINKSIAKIYISEQKMAKFNKLNSDQVSLVLKRGSALNFIRRLLDDRNFVEVITPCIVGVSTDPPKVDNGGVINVDWIDEGSAFLRQSNQLYKQILVASGIEKIYEIGPFWRKEENDSYRHLRESIGLDVEIKNPSDLKFLYNLACEIIKLTNDFVINKFNLPNNLIIPEINNIPVISYYDAVEILREYGYQISFGEDLGIIGESKIGQIIKKKNGYDIFVIINYPDTIKKFYTKNKYCGLTETFDVIVGGWELVSGAIRQTDGEKIKKSMALSNIDIKNYMFYVSIVDKAPEHGGFCIGFDRLIAKILDKEMITDAVLFPRTSKRLIP